jgi:DNA-directed RNA polymerase specialized sigma24 family protein
VADDPRGAAEAPDGVVLNLVRAGEAGAYEILRRRHESAVRRLTGLLVPPADVDEAVAEVFTRVREVILHGGGPDHAFRVYVLMAARSVSYKWLQAGQALHDSAGSGLGEARADVAAGGEAVRLVGAQFQALPERWIAVLWHTEIEGASPADAAQVLGLTAEEVAVLQHQAVDGLRQACLEAYLSSTAGLECERLKAQLAAYIRDAGTARDRAIVTEHLDRCEQCREFCSDLSGITTMLREVVAPIFLGDMAAWYLRAAPEAPVTAGAAARQSQESGAAAGAIGRRLGRTLRTPTGRRWAAVGTAAVLLAGALVLGVSLTGLGTPSAQTARPQAAPSFDPPQTGQLARPPGTHAGRPQPAKAAASPAPGTASASSPAARPSPVNSSRGSSSPAGSSPASPSPPVARAVQLSATVTILSEDAGGFGQDALEYEITFDVADTGNAATGGVDVTLTGAPLSSVVSGSWTCQATSDGATCHGGAIPAGGQAQETVILQPTSQTSCNQPVQLTAVSGDAQASAQSPQVMEC